jgi:hypothetical protein
MADRIDPSTDPTPRGPWPPVTDLTQIYDHGRDWCVHRDAHPDEHDGYPAPSHLPATECRTREYFLDLVTDASTRLDDERDDEDATTAVGLSVYCATAFRFGEARILRAIRAAACPRDVDRPCRHCRLWRGC